MTTTHMRSRRRSDTAAVFLSTGQKIGLVVLAVVASLYMLFAGPTAFMRVVATLVTAFYLLFVGFKLIVAAAGGGFNFPDPALPDSQSDSLPMYGIIVPMRDETRAGFAKLLDALERLRYRTDRLLVAFAVDEDDIRTIDIVENAALPGYMKLVIVPDVGPRTKPKACNFALAVLADVGVQQVTIFDFEDRPEPDHLIKAVANMGYYRAVNRRVACVQGMLQFWNPRGGLASTYYWAEYVVHFRWMLPGLARLGLIPPLGGTSNHFLMSALAVVAGRYGISRYKHPVSGDVIEMINYWDADNVTEDADLAARLSRCGYEVRMGNFVTYEEAPDELDVARKQRSRWLKGFWQTFLVQSRRPFRSMREMGVRRYLAFNLFIGGTPLSLLINPIVWLTTLLYIVSRLAGWKGVTLYIESLFPAPVYYTAMLVFIVGNFVLLYQALLAPLRQQEQADFQTTPVGMQAEQFGLAPRLLLGTALWWIFTTRSAYKAVIELVNPRRRTYWAKTRHSHAVGSEKLILGTGAPAALTSNQSGTTHDLLGDVSQRQRS